MIDNDASWKAVVDLCRGSLVRAQVGARRKTEATLLHMEPKKVLPGTKKGSPMGTAGEPFWNSFFSKCVNTFLHILYNPDTHHCAFLEEDALVVTQCVR